MEGVVMFKKWNIQHCLEDEVINYLKLNYILINFFLIIF